VSKTGKANQDLKPAATREGQTKGKTKFELKSGGAKKKEEESKEDSIRKN